MEHTHAHLLKTHNLSLTSVRLAVLEVLSAHPHADAGAIYDKVQQKISSASKQGIYNNLNALVEHGILREIKPKGQPSLYEMQRGDNHHHIVCRSCHAIADAQCQGRKPCLSPIDDHGYQIDEAEVIYWGICPACQK